MVRSGYSVDEARMKSGDEPLGTAESQEPLIATGLQRLSAIDEPPPSIFGTPPAPREEADDDEDDARDEAEGEQDVDDDVDERSIDLSRRAAPAEPELDLVRRNGHAGAATTGPAADKSAAVLRLGATIHLGKCVAGRLEQCRVADRNAELECRSLERRA